ncbi:MAG TPA: hypothetical protein VMT22_20055 [Terriglobales bacterium]|nr:hypothetical protein [Terriglobales bacterium]
MFADWAKSRLLLIAAVLPPIVVVAFFAVGEWKGPQGFFWSLGSSSSPAGTSVETMRASLAKERRLLSQYEQEQSALRAEVIKRRKLFQEGRASKEQVGDAEKSFVLALKQVHEMRYSVEEADIAITEAVLGEKVLRMPELPVNGFSETSELARFNGGFKWSLKEAPRVEKYFSQTFGRRLPVTAMGQSETHNRLGFDHRDAMDVGLNPDSSEGRALTDYLRKAGIPFIAFRGAVTGASTGPHIHIGRPSGRLARM